MNLREILICFALTTVWSCGPAPEAAAPAPSGRDDGWAKLAPVVQRDCGGCHGLSHPLKFDSGAAFKGSKAKARISNGTMPPSGVLPAADKRAMLEYLED